MNGVRILLLGPPEIQAKGEILAVTRRSTRALIFYLASRGGPVGRDELLALLWGNESEANARRRLRESLSRLKAAFPDPGLIQADTSLVSLDFSQVYVDQLEFQSLVDLAGQLPWQSPAHEPLPLHTAQLLHQAVRLWRSPHFMAGARLPSSPGLDEWLINTANKLEALAGRLTLRLADHAMASGDMGQALHLTRQALAVDELSDNLQYQFLQLLLATGRRKEALRHFEYVEKLFQRELQTAPSPRIFDLYKQLKKERKPHPAQGSAAVWRPKPSLHFPFAGRRAFLSQLMNAYHLGGGVVLSAEAGQGKTRLMQEFFARLDPQPRLLLAACRQAESSLPFQPLIDLLRHHIQPKEWHSLPGAWSSHLALLLPELPFQRAERERLSTELTLESMPVQARSLLMEAIRQILLHISRNRRLLLVIDNAQWADEATLAALGYLLERPPFDGQGLLLVSCRLEEKNPALEASLASWRQNDRVSIITLDRLTSTEISELAYRVFGRPSSDEFITWITAETGGNTFFLLESLRAMLDQAAYPDLNRAGQLQPPRSLKTAIQARLEQLSAVERDILEAAAVIGADFDPQVVAEVCQLPFLDLALQLESLHQRRLVEPLSRDSAGFRYRFIHALVRTILYQNLNPLQRQWLHLQAAKVLEKRLPITSFEVAASLARHYEAGGEPVLAFEYWVQAARHALRHASPGEATQAFLQAEKLIPLAQQLTDEQLYDLYAGWAEAAYDDHAADTIQRLTSRLQELGRERNSLLLLGAAQDGLAEACLATNQFAEGLAYADQAIRFLEKSGHTAEQMNAYNLRGLFLIMLNRVEESIEALQDALSLDSQTDDPQVIRARANAHYQTSIARTLTGWPMVGLRHALLSESSYADLHRPNASAYHASALARYFLGQYHQARLDSLAGIELAQHQPAWRLPGYLHANSAKAELALGNIDAALKLARQAIEIGQSHRHPHVIALGYGALGDLYMHLAEYGAACDHYAQGLEACQDQFLVADHRCRFGLAQALLGDRESGLEEINQARQSAEELGIGLVARLAELALARLYLHDEELEAATRLSLALKDEAERRSLPAVQAGCALILGEIARRGEDLPAAQTHFLAATKMADRLDHPWLAIQAAAGQLKLRKAAGKPEAQVLRRLDRLIERIAASTSDPSMRESLQLMRNQLTNL
jgi:predicted ATPase/DNA-binding SARP family transcriptional activator